MAKSVAMQGVNVTNGKPHAIQVRHLPQAFRRYPTGPSHLRIAR
jgi:hypothetical protein